MSAAVPLQTEVTAPTVADRRPGAWTWRVLRSNPAAVVGLVTLLTVIAAAVLAPVLSPSHLGEQVGTPFATPSKAWPLGLDDGGQNMITDLLYGTRTSLIVGFAATFIAMVIGVITGLLAGYAGGWVDILISRVTDFFLVVPEVPLMIVIASIWGHNGLKGIILVIGLLLWTWTTRVIRAQTKSVKERVYVKRARSLGATHWHTVAKHVLPQVTPLIIVNVVLTMAVAIFDETALAFLGLGDPSKLSLGRLIEYASERDAVSNGAWWAIVPPGVIVAVIILALTLMGTALEDALNPRLRVSHLSRKHFLFIPNRSSGAATMLDHPVGRVPIGARSGSDQAGDDS
jgi:peptide/nickel transport system permease protein